MKSKLTILFLTLLISYNFYSQTWMPLGSSMNEKVYLLFTVDNKLAAGGELTNVNEPLSPGTYEVVWDAFDFASGIYYYKLKAEGFTYTKKMVLIK